MHNQPSHGVYDDPLQTYVSSIVASLPPDERRAQSQEIRAHLEFLQEDFRARGFSPEEARAAALRSFGAPQQIAAGLSHEWQHSPKSQGHSLASMLRFTLVCIGLPVLGHHLLIHSGLYLASTTCQSPPAERTLTLLVGSSLPVYHGVLLPCLGFLPLLFSWQLQQQFPRRSLLLGLLLAVALLSTTCFLSEPETSSSGSFLWCQMMICLGLGLLLSRWRSSHLRLSSTAKTT